MIFRALEDSIRLVAVGQRGNSNDKADKSSAGGSKGMGRCFYKILGVSSRATADEIRRSFRLLALRFHPDRNPETPDASERFREALLAYETLIDRSRRSHYDRARGFPRGDGKRARSRNGCEYGSEKSSSHEEIFEELFGVRPTRRSGAEAVYDLRFDLQVRSSVMVNGGAEEIRFGRVLFCPRCRGSLRAGRGGPCELCRGTGEIMEECRLNVRIPAGLDHGSRLRLQGFGDCLDPGSGPGDLIIVLYFAD
jgi:molecular chaperone DnaJ